MVSVLLVVKHLLTEFVIQDLFAKPHILAVLQLSLVLLSRALVELANSTRAQVLPTVLLWALVLFFVRVTNAPMYRLLGVSVTICFTCAPALDIATMELALLMYHKGVHAAVNFFVSQGLPVWDQMDNHR